MHEIYLQAARELSDASLGGQDTLRLKVISTSMAPLLKPGDYVLVKSTDLGLIHRGDLVVTRRVDGYLTHRLVAVNTQGWHTKGDRNRDTDAPVDSAAILGRVMAVDRGGKIYPKGTRMQRGMARIQGWLGWQGATCRSLLVARLTRLGSYVLALMFRC
jgi:signal peptidase I